MQPRTSVLIGALVCTLGAAAYDHREALLLDLGLEGLHPKYASAVSLAQTSRTFVRHHTNLWVVTHRVQEEGGAMDPDGWDAERIGDSLFVVHYRGPLGERTVEYDFEVDVQLREVRLLKDDPGRADPPTPPDGR